MHERVPLSQQVQKVTAFGLWVSLMMGCGTTRLTDTQRTATEQLLISNAIDQAVDQLDFQALQDKDVYFDPQYLENAVDRGYLVSSLRQHLLAHGCRLKEKREDATFVVEARTGGIGTDRSSLLIGVPQMTVPSIMPGQPSHIPEIPLAKRTNQKGAAKIAVFAYNRLTGRPVWQSGTLEAVSTARDLWLFGAGPFRGGTIRKRTEFAGLSLAGLFGAKKDKKKHDTRISLTEPAVWPDALIEDDEPFSALLGAPGTRHPLALGQLIQAHLRETSSKKGADVEKPFASPPVTLNRGGVAETEPPTVMQSGLGSPER
ncbi:MAG: hypothetical protein KatS3mg105_2599 [Gemmatales bacterium]|nr:MAG: hypothetical protein KatS3mg105_2599 [Gemmatales bacterium]